jgi:hypothetical protein
MEGTCHAPPTSQHFRRISYHISGNDLPTLPPTHVQAHLSLDCAITPPNYTVGTHVSMSLRLCVSLHHSQHCSPVSIETAFNLVSPPSLRCLSLFFALVYASVYLRARHLPPPSCRFVSLISLHSRLPSITVSHLFDSFNWLRQVQLCRSRPVSRYFYQSFPAARLFSFTPPLRASLLQDLAVLRVTPPIHLHIHTHRHSAFSVRATYIPELRSLLRSNFPLAPTKRHT